MRLVFWQNCLSPHQLPYIIELANDDRVEAVDVVVGETISESRLAMGWELPEEKDGKFFLHTQQVQLLRRLQTDDR